MNRHDTTHSDACRLARWAIKYRLAGDTATAARYESRALALAGLVSAGQGLGNGHCGAQAPRGEAFGREARQ